MRVPWAPCDSECSGLTDLVAAKQAFNYLLGQLEQLGHLTRETQSDDQRKRSKPSGNDSWDREKFGQLRRLLTKLNTITTATATATATATKP